MEANVSQFSRAGNKFAKTNFAVFASDQKHFSFSDANFAYETYVSKSSHHENDADQFPVLLKGAQNDILTEKSN